MPAIPPDHRVDAARPGPLDLLADLARRRSDGALALCAGLGLLGAVAAAAGTARWPLLAIPALAAAAVAAFGAWGIADRTAAERHLAHDGSDHVDDALRVLRILFGVGGIAATVGFGLAVMVLLLGSGWF
ncbi:MAG TPA: hypothetical protein VFS08_04285 [Gemmatimonadaceae bacterium]|nr:hypothetical protein [Gemmatimonadaceae bacterium]